MSEYIPKNILVTGGAGFIGSNFIRYQRAKFPKRKIVNVDLLTYAGSLSNLNDIEQNDDYQFIQGDICNQDLVEKTIREYNIDTIVHFAAESHVDRSIQEPQNFIRTNLLGTYVLLEAAKKIWLIEKRYSAQQCRFHHISTDEVYGTLASHDEPFTEETRYQPNSPYSASKAGSDHLVHAYFKTYQLPITMSNCSNNYGPYQHCEKFIPTIINACLNWQPIPIYGDGRQIRDWLYVEDHCVAIELILQRGRLGETYNIGANNERINLEVAREICAFMDDMRPQLSSYSTLLQFVSDRPGHDRRYAINAAKIQNELSWFATTSFEEGLTKTLGFYLQQQTLLAS